jgi:FtsP/CotA-like multicopper oxidase with cupredoxin domain
MHHFFSSRAITPNGTFPGLTIKLQKGDNVNIPVHNALTDPGMQRSTSIVSLSIPLPCVGLVGTYFLSSTGMDSSRLILPMPMDPHESFFLSFDLLCGLDASLTHTYLPQCENKFINQCPIAPNVTFTYAFSTAGQTGK